MRVGLLVNPIAGLGGPAGLKGSDDREAVDALDAEPVAPGRARRFVDAVVEQGLDVDWTTCPAPMGADVLARAGLEAATVGDVETPTTDEDTRRLAPRLAERADVLVVVGGDGTMADVADVLEGGVPVVGVPAGVKMHSGVFAQDPDAAAGLLAAWAKGRADVVEARVLDVDEAAVRDGRFQLQREGLLLTVDHRLRVPSKQPDRSEAAARRELGRFLAAEVETGRWIVGPGSTTGAVKDALDVDGTPLGVDLLEDGEIVVADADRAACEAFADEATRILVTPIGRQGVVFGRGDQPIGPDVIRRVGVDGVVVCATPAKLAELEVVRFDTGDRELDAAFGGHVRVVAGPQHTVVRPVARVDV